MIDFATSLLLELVSDLAAFAALRQEWAELIGVSEASIFNSWEWLYPWQRILGRDHRPHILTARDDTGRLVGLLPLALEQRRVAVLPLRRLAFLGETHVGSDYLDVVARRGYEDAVTAAFAAQLMATRSEWDVLDLLDMDEASPTLRGLQTALAGAGFTVRTSDCSVCPYERLTPGQSFDDFLRGTARRDNYLRRRKWLEKQPGYRIEKISDPTGVPAALDDFLRLHALRWQADGGSEGITGQRTVEFHRQAVKLLAGRGGISFYTMKVGDTAVASVYGMRERDKFIYYQSGYDPAWAVRSVGLVLVGETFKDAVEAGLREYDFLRGSEAYKSDWTSRVRHTKALRAFRPGSRGAWLERQEEADRSLRAFAKRILPSNVADAIRRLRKQHAG